MTSCGEIQIHWINYDLKKVILVQQHRLGLWADRNESACSLGICDKSEYILVEVEGRINQGPHICSKMFTLKFEGNSLVQKAMIDCFDLGKGYKAALECCGYSGNRIFWLGLEGSSDGKAQVFEYYIETQGLKELEDCRTTHLEDCPSQIYREENNFWYSGERGRIIQLEVTGLVGDF